MKCSLPVYLICTLLACACSRTASTPPPTGIPLNFPTPLTSPPTPTIMLAATASGPVALCKAADLQLSSNSNGATGAILLGVTLMNNSDNPCSLAGPALVSLLDGSGQPLDVQYSVAPAVQTPPAPAELQISHGENAIVSLVWRNYCQPLHDNKLTIRLTLSNGEQVETSPELPGLPRCDASGEPSTASITPYSYPP